MSMDADQFVDGFYVEAAQNALPRRDMPRTGLRPEFQAPRPSEEAIREVEAKIAAQAEARRQKTKKAKGEAVGISADAYKMRERRQNPEILNKDRAQARARGAAYGRLAKNHPEEFLMLIQEERKKAGLPVMIPKPRRKGRAPEPVKEKRPVGRPPKKAPEAPSVVLRPPDKSVQDKCRHNMGITKLPYGKFCDECGIRVQ